MSKRSLTCLRNNKFIKCREIEIFALNLIQYDDILRSIESFPMLLSYSIPSCYTYPMLDIG